jgi:hypothetical protein
MKQCIVWLASLLLTVSALADESRDAVSATKSLLVRLLPKHVNEFVFEPIAADNGRDVFEIESRDGKTVIRGNNGVAMAMGLNWFLKHHCLPRVVVWQPVEPATAAAARGAEGAARELGEAPLFPQLLLLRLLAAVVGLGAVGAVD